MLLAAPFLVAALASPVMAQQEVTLSIRGYVDEKVNIAIDDLTPTSPAARTVAEVLAFDLEYSLRFNVLEGNPGVIRSTAPGPDYESWAIFGTEYLVAGTVESTGAGFTARVDIHHVPFQRSISQ
ncbi:MAG: hypothetical protein ACREK2_03965, partial [Gemmatimonadota bacterium]